MPKTNFSIVVLTLISPHYVRLKKIVKKAKGILFYAVTKFGWKWL